MHVIHLVSNNTWGGGEQYVLDLSRAIATIASLKLWTCTITSSHWRSRVPSLTADIKSMAPRNGIFATGDSPHPVKRSMTSLTGRVIISI